MSNYKSNAFPLTKEGVNLTSGTFTETRENVFVCAVAGDLTITWHNDDTSTISCEEGNAFTVESAKQIVITSGTFHKK